MSKNGVLGSGRLRRVVVTGSAGFLGANLCERLLREGYEVIGVDNLSTGCLENVLHLRDCGRFELLQHDVTNPLSVQCDSIFNLACCASPAHYQADPVQTIRTCLEGSLNVLGLARWQQASIFQASTSEVYGDPEVHPQRENYHGSVNTVGPRACYDEGKRCAEALFFDYHRLYGAPIKVGRIFNTYGPRMRPDDGRVISNFIVQALQNRPITIYGDGNQTRSFCYVDDLIEAILKLMAAPADFTGPVNLGNPAEVTVRELARRIIDLTGSRSPIVFKPLPVDDPNRRCPDITLARQRLGWSPVVSLDEGLTRTVAYFEEQLRQDHQPLPQVSGGY